MICDAHNVPAKLRPRESFGLLRVSGTLAFTDTGVLASLAEPLAAAGIPLFAVSTHDTDYLLVPHGELDAACSALVAAGHAFA